jgi:RNA polymerase sigma-70 factor (ECF subfamily)
MPSRTHELLALYEVHAPMVFRRAHQLLGREPDAWDVVHDTFVVLLEQAREFRKTQRPVSYLFGVTTHLCLRRLRDGRTEARAHSALLLGDVASTRSGDGSHIAREFLVRLARELDGNERAMEVAVYKYLDGMTQDQIAATMGVSRKTVQRDLDGVARLAESLVLAAGSVT